MKLKYHDCCYQDYVNKVPAHSLPLNTNQKKFFHELLFWDEVISYILGIIFKERKLVKKILEWFFLNNGRGISKYWSELMKPPKGVSKTYATSTYQISTSWFNLYRR